MWVKQSEISPPVDCPVTCLKFSPNGNLLCASFTNGFICVYNTETKEWVEDLTPVSWDGKTAFTGTEGQSTYYELTVTDRARHNSDVAKFVVDKLAPTEVSFTEIHDSSSITVTASATDVPATAEDACSGIKEYRFSKDSGSTWSDWQAKCVMIMLQRMGVLK